MKVHRLWILTLICFTLFTSSIADDPKIVCYYTNWSIYRPGNAKYSPQNINPYLCTHLIYAFGGFTKDNTLQPFDKYQDIEKGGYAKFTGLKTYNKNLKTLLAIGGWNEGSARFSPLVGNAERRREFVKNAVRYLRQNHFDGLDLDWEYPTFRDGGKSKDRANYAQFVQELSEEFDRESSKTGRPRLLLTLAIPAGVDKIDKGYDVVKLNQYLDWFNVLTYDYHDSFEPATNHHAPLYSLEEDNEYNYDSELNIDFSVKHLINAGADRQKLILGIPTYGRSYTLFNADATDIGAPTDGPGEPGDATREKGFLAYYEICENIKSDDNWIVMHPNEKAMGPYSYKNDQWISYDDEQMAKKKAIYVAENNLGGIMFWSIDTDDFRGTCSGKPYPLIEAAKEGLLDALGGKKAKDPPGKTRTRNRNRPNTEQKTQSPTNFKDNFNRRRKPSPKTTVRPTQSSLVYNSKTTTPEPPTTPDTGSDFKCEEDGFFSHPRDCKRYFWCLDSGPSNLGIVAHQFTCPSGLVFNKQADSCDYSRNVVCSPTKPKPPPTTTYRTTTKFTTTQRTTTYLPRTTTTTTTPAYEDDEDVYDYENTEPEKDIEDPKVIKELIDLIRKAGGLEELEKQLKLTEESFPVSDNTKSDKLPTTQSTFSKSLYDKFLKRKQLENRFVKTESTNKVNSNSEDTNNLKPNSTRYSSVIRNSRPNSQIAGLENLPEFEGFLKEKPQYVTIQRFRSTTDVSIEKVQNDDDDDSDEITYDRDEDDSRVKTSTKSAVQPQYVNIQRNRFTTPSTYIAEVDELVTNAPQYTTLNRRRKPEIIDIAEILQPVLTTPATEVYSTLSARTQMRYKPISRTTTAAPPLVSAPYAITKYYDVHDEEIEISTENSFLNSDVKYQNTNRRTLIKPSFETTLQPIEIRDIDIPQTTEYEIKPTQTEITTPFIIEINLNKTDELTTNYNQYDYNLTTPNTNIIIDTEAAVESDSNQTPNSLNEKDKILLPEDEVTVENVTEFITTQLSSPSPFEFQKHNDNKRPLNQTSDLKESTTLSVEDIDTVTEITNKPTFKNFITTTTTTTNKPTILHHIFAIDYDSASDGSNINPTLGQTDDDSKEELSKRLEKLVEINRIVVVHSKQEKSQITNSNKYLEQIPNIDKISEISRWISIKLQNNNNPINSTHQMPNRNYLFDSKYIFDVETSTIPLEGLFDQNKIIMDNNYMNDNEVTDDYQIIKPPFEIDHVETMVTELHSNEEDGGVLVTCNKTNDCNQTGELKDASNPRHDFKLHQMNQIKDSSAYDFIVNRNHSEGQISPKSNSTIIEQTSSTIRPFQNFKKKLIPSRVSPSLSRRRPSFTTSTTAQPSTNLNKSFQKTTPKIIIRRKLYSRPGALVTKPTTESTTTELILDATPEPPKRRRKPPSTFNNKFVRPLRKNNQNNAIPQRNVSTIVDDQFLSQTITTNNKQLATEINQLNNSSFVDDEISDVLKAMSKTPLPVSSNDNKSRQTIKTKTLNRRPSKPDTVKEVVTIKSTTEGRRKLFDKIPPKSDIVNISPKTISKLQNDYDYYDDIASQLGHRDSSQVKVVLHGTDTIECLDQGNFPHPLSCKKFISCAKIETGGVVGWEYTCPKGLNYDPVGGICNWATGLGCKDN